MISVIIPALNEEEVIAGLLVDLQSASPGEIELIVADGGSSDATVQVSIPYAKVVSSKRGRAGQMNRGAMEASGDILLFLHADTRLPENFADIIKKGIGSAVGGRFDLKLDSDRIIFRIIAFMINFRSRLTGVATGDQAIFVTRAAWNNLGGFADMPLMEDVDFMIRLKKTGSLFFITEKVVTSARRWQQNGVFRTIITMWMLKGLYYLGVGPEKLARYYY